MTMDPRPATFPPRLRAAGTSEAEFEAILAVADLPPGTMRRLSRGDLDILLANTPSGIVATDDRCPHMSAPLSIGELDGCVVACPLHEGRFDLCTGETIQMPPGPVV
jgi:nitrite reductase/ring-hydroxylating ferredoxin subunit